MAPISASAVASPARPRVRPPRPPSEHSSCGSARDPRDPGGASHIGPLDTVTSARSLRPRQVTFIASRDEAWYLGVPVLQPAALRGAGSPGEGVLRAQVRGRSAAAAPPPRLLPLLPPHAPPPPASPCAGTSLDEAHVGRPAAHAQGFSCRLASPRWARHQPGRGVFFLVSFCIFSYVQFSFFLFLIFLKFIFQLQLTYTIIISFRRAARSDWTFTHLRK